MTNICLPSTSTIWPLANQSWIPPGSSFSWGRVFVIITTKLPGAGWYSLFMTFHPKVCLYLFYAIGIFQPLVKPQGPTWEHSWLEVQEDQTALLKDFSFVSILPWYSFLFETDITAIDIEVYPPTVSKMNLRSRRSMAPVSNLPFITGQSPLLLNWHYVFPCGAPWWDSCVRSVHRSLTPITGVFEYGVHHF